MKFLNSYRYRLRRKRLIARAWRKSSELKCVVDRSSQIKPEDILVFSTLRNEKIRLAYFLDYYRDMGVRHFFMVDNDSTDGSAQYLASQRDVTLFSTNASYKTARFGVDWLNHLQTKFGQGHWCLVVDPDEFFVYPFSDSRSINALTDWLDATDQASFSAMLLDLYPKGSINEVKYTEGQNPIEICNWFDSGNYTYKKNEDLDNIWIQGGPRTRRFFADDPYQAPALNKTPLVKWDRSYVYVSSSHSLLPKKLNRVYATEGGERASGILLHTKFLDTFETKAKEEIVRAQHYANSREYLAYSEVAQTHPDLWCKWSEKYINWRQLEVLGLMSRGNWA